MTRGDEVQRAGRPAGILSRLVRDRAGNTMAIVAAALVPIAGMIGSGVDMGRAHLAQTKLQTACDAAALATRRVMAGGTLNETAREEGRRFFGFNFPAGTMESSPVNLSIEASPANRSVIQVSASTEVPTAIMHLFGTDAIPIAINCSADQDYINNDIMLVLDVTGSMNCTAGTACDYAATEQTNSRLSRMRAATVSLYRSLADASGVRTRYGFMPYSMTVNVGADMRPAGFVKDSGYYWTRVCTAFNGNGSCRTAAWQSVTRNHSALWMASTWQGCVEERSTLAANNQDPIRITNEVTQADIDTVSTTDARLRWQPYAPDVANGYTAAFANLASFCPARASRLASYTSESAFQNRVNASLTAVGGYTNHDLGMSWGLRYLSSTGPFAADNPTIFNDIRVAKHIIFMTDGVMTALGSNYSSHGIHDAEPRMIGSASQVDRHKARFLATCNRARQMGATVWVIALDVQTPNDIRPCASGSDHFFVSNGSDLDQVFTLIGRGIGRLRMTQ